MAQGIPQKQTEDRNGDSDGPINEQEIGAEFAKAFQELARGEQTAASLESRLNDIESRIDQLLASTEENARQTAGMNTNGGNNAQPTSKTEQK